ncbi:MAG: radical SAM protein, partial [Ignavibacteria bacterium]
MLRLSPEAIWNLNEKEILSLLDSGTIEPRSREIRFYAPSFMYYKTKDFCSSTTDFPTISVTGNSCALNCKHCGGKVLETMHPALSADELFELGTKLKHNNAKGVLVSGGCLPEGSVPVDTFVPILGKFKKVLGFTVFVHTGIIGQETALALKNAGVDAALIDVIGSTQTMERIFNLKVTLKDYTDSLMALQDAGLPLVPHVIVGLNEGNLDGELRALQMIKKVNPSAIVIIAFMPIQGTEMARVPPPKPIDIAKVIVIARLMFPQTPLVLGCMRPKGKDRNETDLLALKAGVDAIAFPSEAAIDY